MSRLTNKDISGNYDLTYENGDFVRGIMPNEKILGEIYINGMNKLGKLEDLEDELGCPLDIVFKALKDGIVYEENNKFITDKCIALHFLAYEKEWALIYDIDFMYSHLLKDYKKTWWLKEDLSE